MPFTGPTSGNLAGAQANDNQYSYILESTYGTAPTAGAWQRLRLMSENIRANKTRARPQELSTTYESSAAITTQVGVSGTINGALSTGTWDDMLAGALMSDFVSLTCAITSGTGNAAGSGGFVPISSAPAITLNASSFDLTPIPAFGVLSITGDTAQSNGPWAYVKVNNNAVLIYPLIGTQNYANHQLPAGANIIFKTALNGATFKSYSLQAKIGNGFLLRTGGFVNRIQVSAQQGQFTTIATDFQFANEVHNTADAAAGGYTAAPVGTVHDTVYGFAGVMLNGAQALVNKVTQCSLTIARDGADQDYAMGTPIAVGQRPGSILVSGSIQVFFADYTMYDSFQQEAQGMFALTTRDRSGAGYTFFIPNAQMMNPQVNAGGKNQPVLATFDIEGNPSTIGGTMAVGRF